MPADDAGHGLEVGSGGGAGGEPGAAAPARAGAERAAALAEDQARTRLGAKIPADDAGHGLEVESGGGVWRTALRARSSYTSSRRSSHCSLRRTGRTNKLPADDTGPGLEVDSGGGAGGGPGVAAPALAGAEGQEPKERPGWWRTRRGRSYTLHPAEELAETRADAAAVPVRTGAGAAAPVENRGRCV